MIKVKLRDLKKGDNVAIFRPYEKEKYTIIDVGLREDSNGEEVVGVVMRSDAGHVRVTPYMPADNEVTLWEEITEDTEFDNLYAMLEFKSVYRCDANTIKEVKELFKSSEEPELLHQIYAMVDGKLQLIYERDNHGSN